MTKKILPMNYVFRLDSGTHFGSGHAMRCAVLARTLVAAGGRVAFICKDHLHNYNQYLRREFNVFEITGGSHNPVISQLDNYEEWLGSSWDEDLEETNHCLNQLVGPIMVIVDHYALDERFEKGLKANKVFVIDDVLNRRHDCDYLLDQNFSFQKELYRKTCVPKTTLLLGPKYALLRENFKYNRPRSVPVKKEIKKIVAFMGGNDRTRELLKITKAYLNTTYDADLHLVLNRSNYQFEKLGQLSELDKRIYLWPERDDYDDFIKNSDIFFGAAGSSSWERACLGIASFVIYAADNQKILAQMIKKNGMAYVLGDGFKTTQEDWSIVLNKLMLDLPLVQSLRDKSYNICDGDGAQRVLKFIT